MNKEIFAPPTLTAFLQNIQHALASAHAYHFCFDTIKKTALPAFVEKWEAAGYGLRCDAPARAYRKRKGRASVVLCISNDFVNVETETVDWIMLSTPGKRGLLDKEHPLPGKVFDARQLPHLRVGDYEFLNTEKAISKTAKDTTWTWRMTMQRYKEWEAWLIEAAKLGNPDKVQSGFTSIRNQPMAAGVRAQVYRLEAETNKFLKKIGKAPVMLGELPVMRKTTRKSDQSV